MMITRPQDVFDQLEIALSLPESRQRHALTELRRSVEAISLLHWIALHRTAELRAGCCTAIYRGLEP